VLIIPESINHIDCNAAASGFVAKNSAQSVEQLCGSINTNYHE